MIDAGCLADGRALHLHTAPPSSASSCLSAWESTPGQPSSHGLTRAAAPTLAAASLASSISRFRRPGKSHVHVGDLASGNIQRLKRPYHTGPNPSRSQCRPRSVKDHDTAPPAHVNHAVHIKRVCQEFGAQRCVDPPTPHHSHHQTCRRACPYKRSFAFSLVSTCVMLFLMSYTTSSFQCRNDSIIIYLHSLFILIFNQQHHCLMATMPSWRPVKPLSSVVAFTLTGPGHPQSLAIFSRMALPM